MHIVVYNIRLSNIDQLSDGYCSLQYQTIIYRPTSDAYYSLQYQTIKYRPTVRCILLFTISDYYI